MVLGSTVTEVITGKIRKDAEAKAKLEETKVNESNKKK